MKNRAELKTTVTISLLLSMLVISRPLSACICVIYKTLQRAQEASLQADCIFLVEVSMIDAKKGTYVFRLIESLNTSDEPGSLFLARNIEYCEPYIDHTGQWLLYGNIDSGYFEVDYCSISRSFANPEYGYSMVPISPPDIDDEESLEAYRDNFANRREQARIDLEEEIKGLHRYFQE